MHPPPVENKTGGYYRGLNLAILQQVPSSAKRILEVGCSEGRLGEALKQADKSRTVYGIEYESEIADRAAKRLDHVFNIDIEKEDPDIEPKTLDCIIYGDVLEHLVAPEKVLLKQRKLLNKEGIILCSIPNVQHNSLIRNLLRSDWQYTDSGLLDATHLRFFSYSTFIKLLLDCGFLPSISHVSKVSGDEKFYEALEPMLNYLGLNKERTIAYMDAFQFVFKGIPLERLGYSDHPYENIKNTNDYNEPLSFISCVNNDEILNNNLLMSPCLKKDSRHEIIVVRNCRNAAEGFQAGLEKAKHSIVVLIHQDMYLPNGWDSRFISQFRLAEKKYGQIGVAGICGITFANKVKRLHGHVIDRHTPLRGGGEHPVPVDTLDEIVLAFPRNTTLKLDSRLGFHFYGADVCIAARKMNLVSVALDALCFHNSINVEFPPAFYESAKMIRNKWVSELPIATNCTLLE